MIALAERIGHDFADLSLLQVAMCHRSWCAEHPGGTSNERLEFLGDAVLGAVVAEHLYRKFPEADEGWLSRARATIVRATTLAETAQELGLGQVVKLGKGEEATGGREKPSILSDALEAVIGAVHLDGGRPASDAVVMTLLGSRLEVASGEPGNLDDKSRLQEIVSQGLRDTVSYRVSDSGPEHDKIFNAVARVGDLVWGTGMGRSKKQAEQLAARAAHEALVAFSATDAEPRTDHQAATSPSDHPDGDDTDGDDDQTDEHTADNPSAPTEKTEDA